MSIWPREAHPGPALERGAPSVAHRLHCRAEERWWRKRGEAHLFAGTVCLLLLLAVTVAVLNACRWVDEEGEEKKKKDEDEEEVEEEHKRRADGQAER